MIIKKLLLRNFRNVNELELEFDSQTNVFYGDNAQGKTNIVEAIGFLSMLKSFRNDENQALIAQGKENAVLEAQAEKNGFNQNLRIVIGKTGCKTFLNKQEVKKASDFIGLVNVVTFSPADVGLFKASPRDRREFIDDELSKLSPSYYMATIRFHKILKERNENLKAANIDKNLIEVLTMQYAKANYEMLIKRREMVAQLTELINARYQRLSGQEDKLSIVYLTQLEKCNTTNEIYEMVLANYNDDCYRQSTQIGVNRDDILLQINGKPIANYGSQGQNRLAAVALKLSSTDVVKKLTGEEAIIVLDDVLSELDKVKQRRLLQDLENDNQLFITTAQDGQILEEIADSHIKSFLVKSGTIGGNENGRSIKTS